MRVKIVFFNSNTNPSIQTITQNIKRILILLMLKASTRSNFQTYLRYLDLAFFQKHSSIGQYFTETGQKTNYFGHLVKVRLL